ncbi:MAG: hypothetical protein E6J20_00140 [Chloroflexi bacterium]|nr:MAG: hypothetical protein E6J20_00140 [Chloroflexota bacterium]
MTIATDLPMDTLHKRADRLLAENVSEGERILAKCVGADDIYSVVVTDRRVFIIKVGWRTGQTGGGAVTSYDHRTITSVEVRFSMLTGIFEVTAGGMQNKRLSAYGKDAREAPNAFPIQKKQTAKFQQVAALIREQAGAASAPVMAAPATEGIPDQIAKLASLRDAGILTADEFEAKKAELLARL